MSSDDTSDGLQEQRIDLSVSTLDKGATMSKARETTQLDERRIAIDAGLGIQPPYDPETLAAFQEINETHQACVRKKSRYEVGYGFDIVPHSQADEPDRDSEAYDDVETLWRSGDSRWQIGPEGTAASTPEEVLELARQDYHGIGWAALEILVEGDGTPIGLAHVPATTVRVRKTSKTIETEDGEEKEVIESGHGYLQVRQGRRRYFGEAGDRYGDDPTFVDRETGDVASDPSELDNEPANELLFIPNPSPLSLYYGVPDWVAAMQTMGADQAAKEWNHDTFEHLGIPYYVVKVTGGTLTEDSRKELRELMDNLKGTRYRTAILEVEEFLDETDLEGEDGAEADIELEPIGSREDLDMEFQAFRERNEHEIAKVHEVPPILINVTSTSNRANSEAQVQEFAQDVIAPEQAKFEARLYKILHQTALGVDDWTIDFELRGGDNPKQEAQMTERRVRSYRLSGVATVNQTLEELGLPTRDDEIGDMTLAEYEAEIGGDAGAGGGGETEASQSVHAPPEENKIGEREWEIVENQLATKDAIEQTQFNSSNLSEGLYDIEAQELYLSFERPDGQNSLYVYVDVPQSVWAALTNAGSHGSYHYEHIRLEYGYMEITNFHSRLPEGPAPDPEDVPDDIPSGI
jgi:PBSX family phage portal protein